MVRKHLKNTNKNEKIKAFLEKYKVPSEFTSTTRRMISRGVFIGVFLAFIPMPMQMLAVLIFTPFIRFNVPVALVMCWITNPFTIAPVYYVEYLTGAFLLGMEIQEVQMSVDWFNNNFTNILIPLYFGAFIYSTILSFLAYYLVTHLWKNSVHKDRNKN